MPTNPPQVVGDYQLLRRVGEGSFWHVFTARHQFLNRLVTVKMLRETAHERNLANRAVSEARLASQLEHHPNILGLVDMFEFQGTPCLVMEYIEPGSMLDQILERQGPLSVRDACSIIQQTAAGLQYIHQQGIIHRDIKPNNLVIQQFTTAPGHVEHKVKITDFGIAMDFAGRSHENFDHFSITGTPRYMAPEQIQLPTSVDHRTDLYGLGCTFYEVLTGLTPSGWKEKLRGGQESRWSLMEILHNSIEEPIRIEVLRSEVPREVAWLLHKLLALRPADRIQSAAEVVGLLSPFTQERRPDYYVITGGQHGAVGAKAREEQPTSRPDRPSGEQPTEPALASPGREEMSPTETRQPTIFLNVWFPEYPGQDVCLPVGGEVKLLVNLGPMFKPTEMAASEGLPDDIAEEFWVAKHVDVLVMCPGATVTPIRRRIAMPPGPQATAEFTVKARRRDNFELTVVLSTRGEPVYSKSVPFRAEENCGGVSSPSPSPVAAGV